jgi:UDP-glucose 4-epimerase
MILGFDPLFQFMHEHDAVRAIILALERKLRGVYNVAGPQALPLSELIRVTGRAPIRIARVLHPLLLGRLGLPRLSTGAVAHIKYPIVISDQSFRLATGFVPEHGEYDTLAAFRAASPPRGERSREEPPAMDGTDGVPSGPARVAASGSNPAESPAVGLPIATPKEHE